MTGRRRNKGIKRIERIQYMEQISPNISKISQ